MQEILDYHHMYDEYVDNNTPIITVEVMVDSSAAEHSAKYNVETQTFESIDVDATDTGVHFLMDNNTEDILPKFDHIDNKEQETPKARNELLEYMIRNDGSVICKLCGEILQSRTHWYRHKYKQHVMQQMNPSPLFQCEQCLVYFKSRKGYIGHIASRHSELLADSSPVLTNTQAEALSKEKQPVPLTIPETKDESDPEMSIPISSVLNYQTSVVKHNPPKAPEPKKYCRVKETVNKAEWEEQRSREEKLVADIIERVRRECETQQNPTTITTRKSYSRRTTAMHT